MCFCVVFFVFARVLHCLSPLPAYQATCLRLGSPPPSAAAIHQPYTHTHKTYTHTYAATPIEACAPGLTCHPVINTCYPSPRLADQPCVPGSADHECGPGLKCHALLMRCFNETPAAGQICDEKTPCAAGLSCDLTVRRE